MKIVFICVKLTGGGAERVCVDVANGLADLGHQIIIITDLKQPVTYQPSSSIKLLQLPCSPNPIKWRMNSFIQLIRVLRREKPQAIISFMYLNATFAKVASKLTVNCPVIASDHNSFERPASAPMKRRDVINKFWRNYYFDGLTVLTQADKDYLKGRFRHTYVMPNPLELIPLSDNPPKEKTILAVGRVDAWFYKGFDLLIKAWNIIGCDYPEWCLKIIGNGDERSKAYLKSLATGKINVEFLPYTPKIQEEFKKAEVFVLSSRYEGFGLVLTEAMSQGCACVACDYKGRQAEIIKDGEDGLLCHTEDEQDLAAKIKAVIDNDDLRRKFQKTAIKSVERFSIENTAKRWEHMLIGFTKE